MVDIAEGLPCLAGLPVIGNAKRSCPWGVLLFMSINWWDREARKWKLTTWSRFQQHHHKQLGRIWYVHWRFGLWQVHGWWSLQFWHMGGWCWWIEQVLGVLKVPQHHSLSCNKRQEGKVGMSCWQWWRVWWPWDNFLILEQLKFHTILFSARVTCP